MRKAIIVFLALMLIQVSSFADIYKVPTTVHIDSKSQKLAKDFQKNVHGSSVSLAPVLVQKEPVSLSQVGIVHNIVNSNYMRATKTFDIDLFI